MEEEKIHDPDEVVECDYCGSSVIYHDYFGRICSHQDGFIAGNIYKCVNEYCAQYYHDLTGYGDDTIREGFPC